MSTLTVPIGEETNRSRISKMLITLFEHWQLNSKEQLSLLGLAKSNRAQLARYSQGHPITNDRDKLERAGILLGIHKSLRLLFPHNRDLAYAWMKTPNRAFNGATPTQLIDQQGMIGLYMVRAYLDRQRGQ